MYVEMNRGRFYETSSAHTETLPPGYYAWDLQQIGMFYIAQDMQTETHAPFEHQQAVLSNIRRFMDSADAYKRLGLTYKRGFLLHGGPGCGKTTTARMAAAEWVSRGGIVLCKGPQNELPLAIARAKAPVLVLIDDVDGWEERRLTHAMDGLEHVSNVCWLATTNFLGRVSERLRRPGRFDEVIEVVAPAAASQLDWVRGLDIPDTAKAWVIEQAVDCSPSQVRELVVRAGIFNEQRPLVAPPTIVQGDSVPAKGSQGMLLNVQVHRVVADGSGGFEPLAFKRDDDLDDDLDED